MFFHKAVSPCGVQAGLKLRESFLPQPPRCRGSQVCTPMPQPHGLVEECRNKTPPRVCVTYQTVQQLESLTFGATTHSDRTKSCRVAVFEVAPVKTDSMKISVMAQQRHGGLRMRAVRQKSPLLREQGWRNQREF